MEGAHFCRAASAPFNKLISLTEPKESIFLNPPERRNALKLLVDGKNAFPKIIECIRDAHESILINMFIWRNDSIGNTVAKEILSAAERGVKITISKDRYGVVCESCEENRKSFFNRKPNFTEKVKISALKLFYNREPRVTFNQTEEDSGELLGAVLNHPNITVACNTNKYDHCKYYVFDNKTVIVGGINIEDKENGCDYAGRQYRDYMVMITEENAVAEFLDSLKSPGASEHFKMNIKKPVYHFGMKEAYLELIRQAEEYLTIVMAYYSPLPEFENAVISAAERGVKVKIVIPAKANFQDSLNKKTVSRLIGKSNGKIKVCGFDGMLHAKLLMSEKTISLGSCNITKKAFGQLDELNVFVPNDERSFALSVKASVEDIFRRSEPLEADIRYNPFMAAAESLLV